MFRIVFKKPLVCISCAKTQEKRFGSNSTKVLSSVQFSHSVMSDSLWPQELQIARPPCPTPTPGVYLNSCPLSQWCHPTISSSVVPLCSCLQSFPASGSFKWVHSSHQLAKVLEFQLQHQFFQWIFRTDFLWIDWFDLLAVQGTLLSLLQGYPDDSVVKHLPAKAGDLGLIPDLGRSHLVWSS